MPKIRYLSTGAPADLSTEDLVGAHKRIVANSPTFAQKVADIEASGIPVTVTVVDGSGPRYQALAAQDPEGLLPGHEEAFAFTVDIPSSTPGNPPDKILVYISYQFLQKAKHQTGAGVVDHTLDDTLIHEIGVHVWEKATGVSPESPDHDPASQNAMKDELTGNTDPVNHNTNPKGGASVDHPETDINVNKPGQIAPEPLLGSAPGDGLNRQGAPAMLDSSGKRLSANGQPSPLVLDVDASNTIELVDLSSTDAVYFDVDNNGFAELTGWITGGDGLLALDVNQDGIINNGRELFGDQTGYDNGFLSLAAHDSNSDGAISPEDQVWGDLRVWVDANQNGYSEAEELHTLDSLSITAIDLSYTDVNYDVAGNTVRQESTFTMNGNTYDIVDSYFKTNLFNSIYDSQVTLDLDAEALLFVVGYGTLPDLNIAMALDNDDQDANSLITLVAAFSELELSDIFAADTAAMDAVRSILYRWANVDDVSPTSRGPYVDAQELGFLEAMTGQPFLQQGYRPDPLWQAGADLTEAFALAHRHYFATLVAQTAAGEMFTGDFYYNSTTDSVDGITGLNTDVLDDLETAAAALSTTLEKEELWSNVVRMIEYTVGVDNLDSTSLAALEDAIDAAGSDLTFLVDSLVETPEPNEISGTSGVDTLSGTSGRDVINAGADNDTLEGLGGIDELYGSAGSDTLIGGAADDYLSGGTGADTYVYHAGDGVDVIDDNGSSVGDKILFGAGFDAGDLTFTRVGRYDLQISLDNGTDTGEIVIADQFGYGGGIETIEFDDTTTIDLTAMSHAQTGTAGNDTLYGVQYGGVGNDTLYGLEGDDTLYGYDGTNILDGGDGNDRIYGGNDADTIYGGAGDDVISGDGGNNVFYAGSGNDTITSEAGNDVYNYASGHDVYTEGWGGADVINMAAGYVSGSTLYYKINNDLKIVFDQDNTITVGKFFQANNYRIETLNFDGGPSVDLTTVSYNLQGGPGDDTLTGSSGADVLYGEAGNDTLSGGAGDDTLHGGTGNDSLAGGNNNDTLVGGAGDDYLNGGGGDDLYIYHSGHDTIYDYYYGNDTLRLAEGWAAEDVAYRRYTDDLRHLVVELNGGAANSIVIERQFDTTSYRVETLDFDGNDALTLTAQQVETHGTEAADVIGGITVGASPNDVIYGHGGNDTLEGKDGEDYLDGGDGDDHLLGNADADTLVGGAGDDYLNGGGGDDLYIYHSGHDTIYDYYYGNDTLRLAEGWSSEDVVFRRSTDDLRHLVIELDGGAEDSIVIERQFDTTSYRVETLDFDGSDAITLTALQIETHGSETANVISGITHGALLDDIIFGYGGADTIDAGQGNDYLDGGEGDDTLSGDAGNDTLSGGAGNDYLDGGSGNDTYVYSSGLDTIYDVYGGTDKLIITGGVTIDDITTSQNGNDAHIVIDSGLDEITITRQHYSPSTSYQIETVQFDDGFVTTLTDHLSWIWGTSGTDTLAGTSGHDTIIGMDGDDGINGGGGADNLHGGAGNDTIRGGDSSDLLHGGLGDDILFGDAGADTIFGGGGADTFTFEAATAYSGIDLLKDFSTAEGDKIDLLDVLDGIYDPMSDDLLDFVQLAESAGDTLVSIDRDGAGSTYGWTQIAAIQGVTGLGDADAMVAAGQLLAA